MLDLAITLALYSRALFAHVAHKNRLTPRESVRRQLLRRPSPEASGKTEIRRQILVLLDRDGVDGGGFHGGVFSGGVFLASDSLEFDVFERFSEVLERHERGRKLSVWCHCSKHHNPGSRLCGTAQILTEQVSHREFGRGLNFFELPVLMPQSAQNCFGASLTGCPCASLPNFQPSSVLKKCIVLLFRALARLIRLVLSSWSRTGKPRARSSSSACLAAWWEEEAM